MTMMMIQTTRRARVKTTDFTTTTTRRARTNRRDETMDVADDGSFAFARAFAFESSNRVAIVRMNRDFAGKRDARVMTRQRAPPHHQRHPRRRRVSPGDAEDVDARPFGTRRRRARLARLD
jgi:hypothetical protein